MVTTMPKKRTPKSSSTEADIAKSASLGLYYPYLHFKSQAWLKVAALYWGRMARIVPHKYSLADPYDVLQLAKEDVGFVRNLDPEDSPDRVGRDLVSEVMADTTGFQRRYGLAGRESWYEVSSSMRPPPYGGPPGSDPRLGYVYVEKMSPKICDVLVTSNLAEVDPYQPEWIGMHPQLASVYMFKLAEEMARRDGLTPVTDRARDHVGVSGWTMHRLANERGGDVTSPAGLRSDTELEAAMVSVALRSVLPQDVEHVPIESIIRVRKEFEPSRIEFQRRLREIVANMSSERTVESAEALAWHLEERYKRELKPALDELDRRLRAVGIRTVAGALSTQVKKPKMIEGALAAMGLSSYVAASPEATLAFGVGAVAVSVSRVFIEQREETRQLLQATPEAYLLHVKENLGPSTLVEGLGRRFRRITLGV